MKKTLLLALAPIAVAPVAVEAQSPMDITFMNEIYESRTCHDDQLNDKGICEYNLNDELVFQTSVYSDRSALIDIYRANMHTRERSPFNASTTGGYWLSQSVLAGGGHKIFDLGDFTLESGVVLPDAKLSYVTHGQLNAAKDLSLIHI